MSGVGVRTDAELQATVIFPAALAVAQELGKSGKEFIVACVVGYEVACRTGEYLGPSHYQVRVFRPA